MKILKITGSIYYFFRFLFFTLKEKSVRYLRYYPGHYSSCIPSRRQIEHRQSAIFKTDFEEISGVDLNKTGQQSLLKKFYQYADQFMFSPTRNSNNRYYYKNPMFGFNDAYILSCFLKEFKPERYMEIGSGYSSALVLDHREQALSGKPELTFIEPYPKRLHKLLTQADWKNTNVIQKNIQDVDVDEFTQLQENDILFVDSSHVLRVDSDLSYILFSILPVLHSGVFIHFHDIFWPFEYPQVIFEDGRIWNESYFLRAFLQYNSGFEVVYFSSYMESLYLTEMCEKLPGFAHGTGSSLWLMKR